MSETKKSKSKVPLYVSIALVAGLILSYFLIEDVQNFFNEGWNVLTSDDEQRIKAMGRWVWLDGANSDCILL